MPYILKEVVGGWKVAKKEKPSVTFSRLPLSKKKAVAQRTAIILSEMNHRSHK